MTHKLWSFFYNSYCAVIIKVVFLLQNFLFMSVLNIVLYRYWKIEHHMPKILLENEVVVNLVFLGSKQFRERFSSTEHLHYSFIFSILNTGSSTKNDILVMIKKSLTIWSSVLRLFFKRCTTYVGKKTAAWSQENKKRLNRC